MLKIYKHIASHSGLAEFFNDATEKLRLAWPTGGITVEISRGRNRTREQNDLLWFWAGLISEETGYTKDEVVADWKMQYLAPQLRQESEQVEDLCFMLDKYYEDFKDRRDAMHYWLSSHKLKVGEFSQWLQTIQDDMATKGFNLPDPEKKK